MKNFLYFLFFCTLSSCSQSNWSKKKADTIFYGGDIITVDEKHPRVEAIAIQGEKIIFVGSKKGALRYQQTHTELVDLQGKTLLPGFIAAHTHVIPTAFILQGLQLDPFIYPTANTITAFLQEEVKKGPVLAFRYDPSLMTNPGELNFDSLNAISSTVPILVINTSGHIAYGNSAAFKAAFVTNSTVNPIGGSFQRDAKGDLTGVAFELPAVSMLLSGFPQREKLNFIELTTKAADYYAAFGYTTVTDLALGLPMPTPLENIDLLRKIAHRPNMPVRMQGYIVYPLLKNLHVLQQRNDPLFQVLGVKIWSDGSLQGHTGALTEPYKDEPSNKGTLNYRAEDLQNMVLYAHKQGAQVAVHANGDAAIQETLDAFENALDAYPENDPRFRIEHATLLDRETLIRIKKLKATPSFTVLHIYRWGQVFRDKILGQERANTIDSARTAKELGIKFSLNDDTLAEISPLLFFQIIVTRQMRNKEVLNPDQTISVSDAIKAMTLYPAWQSFRDKELGSITVGKYADLVILDKNPKKVPPEHIGKIRVLETWLNGKRAHTASQKAPH